VESREGITIVGQSDERMSTPVRLGLGVLALVLVGMVIFTAVRFAAGPPRAAAASAATASGGVSAAQNAIQRGKNYVRMRGRDGAVWTYVVPGAPTDSRGLMVAPRRLSLRLETRVSSRVVGIGVRLVTDRAQAAEVQRNGRPAEVAVRVLDAGGRQVASDRGPLSKFGFG
jgi:hypothetical protein